MNADKPNRRWFRFSMRTLLIVIAFFAFWVSYQTHRARQQRRAIEVISQAGGRVVFDFQNPGPFQTTNLAAEPPGPRWLRDLVGPEYFQDVVEVLLNSSDKLTSETLQQLNVLPQLMSVNLNFTKVDDEGLAQFADRRNLKCVWLENCNQVTDKGLAILAGNVGLEYLSLMGTSCTDEGVRTFVPNLRQLKYLDVSGIPITNDTAAQLQGLPNLLMLHLSRVGSRAKYDLSDAVEQIKKSLPNCKINYWPPERKSSETR